MNNNFRIFCSKCNKFPDNVSISLDYMTQEVIIKCLDCNISEGFAKKQEGVTDGN